MRTTPASREGGYLKSVRCEVPPAADASVMFEFDENTLSDSDPTAELAELRIDDRFIGDWVRYGLTSMDAYLAKQARFAAFLEQRDQAAYGPPVRRIPA